MLPFIPASPPTLHLLPQVPQRHQLFHSTSLILVTPATTLSLVQLTSLCVCVCVCVQDPGTGVSQRIVRSSLRLAQAVEEEARTAAQLEELLELLELLGNNRGARSQESIK